MDVTYIDRHAFLIIGSSAESVSDGAAITCELIFGYAQWAPTGDLLPPALIKLEASCVGVQSKLTIHRGGGTLSSRSCWDPYARATRLDFCVLG